MATVSFGNIPVDMRQTDSFGIPEAQEAYNFLETYYPTDFSLLVDEPGYMVAHAWDASYNYMTVHYWYTGMSSDLLYLSKFALEIDSTGFYVQYSGSFSIDITTELMTGTINKVLLKDTDTGLVYASVTGLDVYIDSAAVDSDAAGLLITSLSGNDCVSGGSYADYLKGFAGNDTLLGNGGNDTLNGGTGKDTMKGGAGNDTYIVDNTGDIVIELATQGTDLTQSGITYTLSDDVEKLTLTGSAAINGTGNGLANALTGNGAANQLNGLAGNDTLIGNGGNDTLNGGTWADTMKGGAGADTYVVDNIGDIVTELSGQGADLVQSGMTYTLTANVEKLTLTGTAAINGTGNGLANALTGNSAANQLNGLAGNDTLTGGAGKDALTGGLGNDYFVFNAALNVSANVDIIKDYTTAADTIQLENSIFTKLTTIGALSTANFRVGTAAADANDFIVYNNGSGALYYDADGFGAGAATQFATVYASGTTPASLGAGEFILI